MAAIKPTNPERQRSIPLVPPPRALYQYEPLPVTIPSFRLLRILPGLDDGLIKCELVIREFPLKSAERRQVGLSDDSDHICYNALSYEWGRVPGYSWILLNDGCINVGQNLSDFLHTAHEHMVCRSDSTFADFLWIDALCINQEDIQEKQHQIKRMSGLYQCAQHVFVWLGSHVGKAVHSGAAELRTLGDHFVELYEEPHKTTKTWIRYYDYSSIGNQTAHFKSKVLPALVEIAHNTYWDRMWILQEISVSLDARLMIGHHIIS